MEEEKARFLQQFKVWLNSPPERFPFSTTLLKQWAKFEKENEEDQLWKKWEAEGWGKDRLDDYENHPYWAWKREVHARNDRLVASGMALMACKPREEL